MLGPTAQLNFDVTPFVLDNNTFVFYVASEAGTGIAVQSPITGEITGKGRKLRIRIPEELRQPDRRRRVADRPQPDVQGQGGKKNYVVSSTGCKNRKHKFTGQAHVHRARRPAPVPPPISICDQRQLQEVALDRAASL